MKLQFWKYNPSGNTTIFLDNRMGILPRSRYPSLATELMAPQSVSAEQLGCWEIPVHTDALGRLHMMGGEFCGNATRCFAKLLCDVGLPGIIWNESHTTCTVPVEVSGCADILYVRIQDYTPEHAIVYGAMPLPILTETISLNLPNLTTQADCVHFDGICHLVLRDVPFSKDTAEQIIHQVYAVPNPPEALGVIFYYPQQGNMIPVVYVQGVDSLVYESSCGSGSVATAASCAFRTGQPVFGLRLQQPGGIIEVSFSGSSAEIGGMIKNKTEGFVYTEQK